MNGHFGARGADLQQRRSDGMASPGLRLRLLPALLAACFGTAMANPSGPEVVAGTATFNQQGNLLTVTNSPNAVINWQNFSINAGETTRFDQQSASSAVLNRITGQNPSQILGALQSNGRVFLINPNGVMFGAGAQVDVNGLVASSLNLSNSDFLSGKLAFVGDKQSGKVSNQGAITTPGGGSVFLIAPNVENNGIITSPKGDVVLAAGHTVQLVDSMNPDLHVVLSAPEHRAVNLGQVIAQGGRIGIYGALVNQRGVANADSAVRGENGKIVFKSSRDTTLEAGSQTSAINTAGGGKGGAVHVLGNRVGLFGDAKVDASGEGGGGVVLLGGQFQGGQALRADERLATAQQTVVGKDAVVRADALGSGDGGMVVAWSDGATRMHGSLSAQGGVQGGKGGMVETSGHLMDLGGARVQAGARVEGADRAGQGTWLLDPFDIEVNATGSATLADVDQFSDLPSTGVTSIAASLISGATSNVSLQALNNLSFNSDVKISASGVGLTAKAGRNLTISAPLSTNGGTVSLSANDRLAGTADGTGGVTINSAVSTGGGTVLVFGGNGLTMGTGSSITAPSISISANNITLPSSGGPALVTGSGGSVNIFAGSGRGLDLGVSTKTGTKMELTSAELNSISAGTLLLNADTASSASVTVSGPVSMTGTDSVFVSGTDIKLDSTLATTGSLILAPQGKLAVGAAGGIASPSMILLADSMDLNGAAGSIDGRSGTIIVQPRTSTLPIDLGTTADTSSALGLSSAELSSFKGSGLLRIGARTDSGAINVSAPVASGFAGVLSLHSSGDITQGASAGITAGSLTVDAQGAVTLNASNNAVNSLAAHRVASLSFNNSGPLTLGVETGGVSTTASGIAVTAGGKLTVNAPVVAAAGGNVTLTASGGDGGSALVLGSAASVSGANVVLSADGSFANNSGSATPLTASGRWLVYSASPAKDSKAGMAADFKRYGCGLSKGCASGVTLPGTGNGFLYSAVPVLTVTPDVSSSIYGSTPGAIGSTYTGFVDGDTATTAGVSGSATFSTVGTSIGPKTAAGVYDVAYSGGLASSLGYAFADNLASINEYTVKKAALTITANDASKVFDGIAYSGGNGVATAGFVNGETVADLGGTLSYGGSSQGAVDAGRYVITPGGYTSGNYEIVFVNGVLTISSRVLTVVTAGIVGNPTKTYDGTTAATLTPANFSLSGFVSGDGATVTKTSGSYDSANAGARTVSVTLAVADFQKTGSTNLDNYSLPTSATGAGTIDKASLTLTPATDSKTYDGTTASTAAVKVAGAVPGDTVLASEVFASVNALGAGKSTLIVKPGYSITNAGGADMSGNYSINDSATAAGTITPAKLSITANDDSKSFDGVAYSGGKGVVGSGFVNGEGIATLGGALTYGGTSQGAVNAGSYTIIPGGYTSTNYDIAFINGTLTILPRELRVITGSIIGNPGKTYDGTTAATLTAANFQLDGFVTGDGARVTKTSGSYDSANAGVRTVSVDLAAGDYSPTGTTILSNYTLPTKVTGAGAISKAALSVTAIDDSKVFDGAAYSGGNGVRVSGLVNGETVAVLSGTLAYGGTAQGAVNAGSYTIVPSGYSSDNYDIAFLNGVLTISQRALSIVTAAITGNPGKTYDGTTTAVLTPANFILSGFAGGDNATVLQTRGVYDSANAGARTVTASLSDGDFSALGGTILSNYTLPTSASGAGTISKAALTVTANNDSKVFDGVAYSGGKGLAVSGFVNGETVAALGGSPTFGGTAQGALNAGSYTIVPGGYTSGNYDIAFLDGTLTIAKRALTAVTAAITGNPSKTYDGTTMAILTPANFILSGFVGADGASVGQTKGEYDSANAGARTVSATLADSDFSPLDGTLLSNYTLPTSASGAGTINRASLTLTPATDSKVYDGTTASTASVKVVGAVAGDTVVASGVFGSKNVLGSNGSTLSVQPGYTIKNSALADMSGNYIVNDSGKASGTITPRPLTVAAPVVSKTFDGTTTVIGGSATVGALVAGDSVGAAPTLAYDSKNVGGNKTVLVAGLTLRDGTGADMTGNYAVNYANSSGNSILAPTLSACTATPTAPGCELVLPPTQGSGGSQPVSEAINSTVSLINTAASPGLAAAPATPKPAADSGGSGSSGATPGPAAPAQGTEGKVADSKDDGKKDEKKDEKKDDKTLDPSKDKADKKDEPTKKMYCN